MYLVGLYYANISQCTVHRMWKKMRYVLRASLHHTKYRKVSSFSRETKHNSTAVRPVSWSLYLLRSSGLIIVLWRCINEWGKSIGNSCRSNSENILNLKSLQSKFLLWTPTSWSMLVFQKISNILISKTVNRQQELSKNQNVTIKILCRFELNIGPGPTKSDVQCTSTLDH